jgi:hypothetical protein
MDSPENLAESIKLEASGRQASTHSAQTEDQAQFDYRVCRRCMKNDILAPNFCQFSEAGRRRIETDHLYDPSPESPPFLHVVHPLARGIDREASTLRSYR